MWPRSGTAFRYTVTTETSFSFHLWLLIYGNKTQNTEKNVSVDRGRFGEVKNLFRRFLFGQSPPSFFTLSSPPLASSHRHTAQLKPLGLR